MCTSFEVEDAGFSSRRVGAERSLRSITLRFFEVLASTLGILQVSPASTSLAKATCWAFPTYGVIIKLLVHPVKGSLIM